jgi:TonB family protein
MEIVKQWPRLPEPYWSQERAMPTLTLPSPLRTVRLVAQILGLCTTLVLAACGDDGKAEVKGLKSEVQRAYGEKDFTKGLQAAKTGLALSRKVNGDKAPDTLYFAQAISENNLGMRNVRGAIPALKLELDMRAGAGQPEQKLQPRRTLLIMLAEQSGDKLTAADQAVAVAKGIAMGPGKDPQPVYRTETVYPPEQYRQRVEGDVEITFSLDASGVVTAARVSKATPPMVFDQAALDSFKQWRFTPMINNGQPVSGSGFKFTLAFRMGR